MTVAPANTSSIIVAVTGVLQDPSTYSVSGTTLTFSAAPPSGTSNISVRYLGIPASGVTTTAYRTVTDFTATAGQTSFSVPSYTVGYIDVYRNGVRLVSTDYTATTGTTVVLVNACTSGDSVVTESFLVSSVLNAIPATSASIQQSYLASGVAGTGPTFSYYQSTLQSVPSGTPTKLTFTSYDWDASNGTFSSSRFTPNVGGYYQIVGGVNIQPGTTETFISIYKNGSEFKRGLNLGVAVYLKQVVGLVYCNGSTDYIEIYTYQNSGGAVNTNTGTTYTYFQGVLVRSA
jgi:hypothetical protein